MAVALCSLILLQYLFIKDLLLVKEVRFEQDVNEVLKAVTKKIEILETASVVRKVEPQCDACGDEEATREEAAATRRRRGNGAEIQTPPVGGPGKADSSCGQETEQRFKHLPREGSRISRRQIPGLDRKGKRFKHLSRVGSAINLL